jgi:hypothetical protein
VKTAQDIVAEIEALGNRLSNLEISQTTNLNLNLGLSNLGLLHQDEKFQTSFSNLVLELQEVYEEYRHKAASTDWDLNGVFDAVHFASNLLKEILDQIANEEFSVLDPAKYQSQFSKAMEPFQHLVGYDWRDPIYISMTHGKNYSQAINDEYSEIPTKSGNSLVRINQYLVLLNEIVSSYKFIRARMDGDAAEILKNLEIANELPTVGNRSTFENVNSSEEIFTQWSDDLLPVDYLIEQIDSELFFIQRLYLNMSTSNASWDDMIWHLERLFIDEYSTNLTQYFTEDEGLFHTNGTGEVCLKYYGISDGLAKVRELESAYEDWYQKFQKKKMGKIF